MVRPILCIAVYLAVCFCPQSRIVCGQKPLSSYHDCLAYVSTLEELDTRFNQQRSSGERLLQERRDTFLRLMEAAGTIQHFLNQQAQGAMTLLQAEIAEASLDAQFQQLANVKQPIEFRSKDVRYDPRSQFRQASSRIPVSSAAKLTAQQLVAVQLSIDQIVHGLETVHKAGNLAVGRHMSLVKELQKIASEMQAWQLKSDELINQYWEVADVEGVKSDIELRLALRVLRRASENNSGATFARSITLMRLGDKEESLKLLNLLAQHPSVHLLASSARAELYARLGKKREFQAELRGTMPAGQNDPRVRMHRAQAMAVGGELRQAEREWESVLKLGGHNIAAYRSIALINASLPWTSDRNLEKAVDYANLASRLAGDDWSCEAAVAMVAAASGEVDRGFDTAERASDLAIGSNQALCSELALQIKSGTPVSWEF